MLKAKPSNPNRRAEISRVHSELNRGYKKGGRVAAKDGKWIQKATAKSIKEKRNEKENVLRLQNPDVLVVLKH